MGTTYRQSPLGVEEQAIPTPSPVPPVSVGTFMDRLEQRGVTFDLVADELCVEVSLGALSEAERHELVVRRDEVEALVRVALGAYQPAVAPSEPTAPTQTTWAAA
jgi:hypothetical protein